jgi:hypothetical protein
MPAADTTLTPKNGMSVREVARYLRVSPDKVRGWIKAGALKAINTASALCARPRFVVLPHHLEEWERGRLTVTPPKPKRKRRITKVDYYGD